MDQKAREECYKEIELLKVKKINFTFEQLSTSLIRCLIFALHYYNSDQDILYKIKCLAVDSISWT